MLILHNKFSKLKAAPKDIKANKAYRTQIRRLALVSPQFREECWIRAKYDYVWFVDTFGYTYNSKQHPTAPQRLFILREYQEDLARVLISSVGKNDVVIPKSRDMGASWVCLSVLLWLWQYNEMFTALMGSWKQDYVDKRGDPNSLFWKIDFMVRQQPIWLKPRIRPGVERVLNTLINPLTNSTITGEATNPDFGRAGRPAVVLLDEFAAVDCAYDVLKATGDATNTRWMISTYAGAFGAFYDQVQIKREHTPQHLVELHWTLHPGKRRGLYHYVDSKLHKLDPTYHYPDGYKFIDDGTGKPRSPWYDVRYRNAGSPQEIAQELDMEPQGSGYQFLSTLICKEIVTKQARPCRHRGYFEFKDAALDEIVFKEHHEGDVELWVGLDRSFKVVIEHATAGGADIAMGSLNNTGSNSVFAVYSALTNEKIAQITTNKMGPETFASYVIACCRFFTTTSGVGTLLNWEWNGPGNAFGSAIITKYQYANCWMKRDLKKHKAKVKKTDKPGWESNPDTKKSLLNAYKAALIEDRIVNRKLEAIMECAEYINYHGLKYEHSKALNSTDQNSAGDNHGDMVIADALAYLALADLPVVQVAPTPKLPETSFAALEIRRLAEERKKGGSWGFKRRSEDGRRNHFRS